MHEQADFAEKHIRASNPNRAPEHEMYNVDTIKTLVKKILDSRKGTLSINSAKASGDGGERLKKVARPGRLKGEHRYLDHNKQQPNRKKTKS